MPEMLETVLAMRYPIKKKRVLVEWLDDMRDKLIVEGFQAQL
jgi:hypothetical protein